MSQNGATDKEKFFVVGGIFLLILVNHQVLLLASIKRGEQPLFFCQCGGTYALRGFINLEKLCMLVYLDTKFKNECTYFLGKEYTYYS